MVSNMTRHELEKEVEWLQIVIKERDFLIDILWEYVWEKDYEEIRKRLEKANK